MAGVNLGAFSALSHDPDAFDVAFFEADTDIASVWTPDVDSASQWAAVSAGAFSIDGFSVGFSVTPVRATAWANATTVGE